MSEIYFDNGATTRALPQVREIMDEVLEKEYGNPSSMHMKGFDAEKYVNHAKEIIAKSLKVDPKEIYFTSGGTEANNLALIGTAFASESAGSDNDGSAGQTAPAASVTENTAPAKATSKLHR